MFLRSNFGRKRKKWKRTGSLLKMCESFYMVAPWLSAGTLRSLMYAS